MLIYKHSKSIGEEKQRSLWTLEIEHEKHGFCAAYTHQHMLLFQTGNSASESGNSSVDAFMNENKPHSLLVQALLQLQYDAEQNNRERRELQLMS